jgi:hypothetical protein
MLYVGVDPGKHGGIAVLGPEHVTLHEIPLVLHGKLKGRDEYDLPAIVQLLGGIPERAFFAIEKSQPLPPTFGGSIANFERGVSRGWAWMLTALRYPYSLVAPREWQKKMLAGTPGEDTKQRSILAAQRLFPGVDMHRTPRCKKVHDGFADALLIAWYARWAAEGVNA